MQVRLFTPAPLNQDLRSTEYLLQDRRREAMWISTQMSQKVEQMRVLDQQVEELKTQHEALNGALDVKIREMQVCLLRLNLRFLWQLRMSLIRPSMNCCRRSGATFRGPIRT
jgi:hypothetical protein